jgi:predicted metal-dependent phosphoesterase TrpH
MPEYAELHCHSYFSLLDGAASPEDLAAQAVALGLHSLALTDHDSLAGVIRLGKAAQRMGLHAVIGAEVTLTGGHHLTLAGGDADRLRATSASWSRSSRRPRGAHRRCSPRRLVSGEARPPCFRVAGQGDARPAVETTWRRIMPRG